MYKALYRKYRPSVFSDVIGQEPITKTLKNQIKSGNFAHAYLFTGTRGTGKTTCARILANALNCLNPKDGEPCGECEICKSCAEGNMLDIVEIDAASNSGVEDVRKLREEIAFSPISAKYKVYIIDEVHMLSNAAYNALLKTIEEPPAHAIFILATTEIHKVPATILSRCQRFDFRRVSVDMLADHMAKIAEKEGHPMDRESLVTVARLGDGSVRDSLSVLDKVIGLNSAEEVREVLGVIDTQIIHSLMEAAAKEDIEGLYAVIATLYNGAKDLSLLCREVLDEYRNLLVVKNVKDTSSLLDIYEGDLKRLKEISALYTNEHILYAIDTVQQTLQELSRSSNKRADMEICLLRISKPRLNDNLTALTARVANLEKRIEEGNIKVQTVTVEKPIEKNVSVQEKASEKVEKIAENVPESAEDFIPEPPEERDVYLPEPPEEDFVPQVPTEEKEFSNKLEGKEGFPGCEYQEFASFKDLCDIIYEDNPFVSMVLSEGCEAVFKDTDLYLLCKSERDANDIKNAENMALIQKGLETMRKKGYTIHVEVGRKSKYLYPPGYDPVYDNPMLEFED